MTEAFEAAPAQGAAPGHPALERRRLGSTTLEVTTLCVGTSPLASMEFLYGYAVDEATAVATVEVALASPIRFLDTSNGYGSAGESEVRVGIAIRNGGGLPADYVLATKVDPAPGSSDFSGARVRASLDESLERLGVDRVPLLYLHDPERISFDEGTRAGGPLEALIALRDEGRVDYIGVAGGDLDMMHRYVETDTLDVVLNHNRFTLLDRAADALWNAAVDRGMGIVNAAPYGGGMLVKGPDAQPKYGYGLRGDAIAASARAMADACARQGVPLAAAALQFSMRDARIHSTVVGLSSPARIEQTLALASTAIPAELWSELDALMPSDDDWKS